MMDVIRSGSILYDTDGYWYALQASSSAVPYRCYPGRAWFNEN
jgi:hypothetical protein